MKRTLPVVLLIAVVLVATGLLLADRDQASQFTADPDARQAYLEGERLLQSFRYAEAEELLEKAVELDPGLTMAHVALAELRYRMGFRKEGRELLALADSLAADVTDPEARLLLLVRLSNSAASRFHDSRDSLLAAAAEVAPDHVIVLVTEANRASAAGDVARAEEIWKHVLEVNPNYAGAYNYLGYLYLAQGRYDEAESAMRRYAFVAPDLANPHDSLGEVLMTIGRYEEAEVEFRTALAKQPDFFHSLVNIGHIYMMRGEVDRANELYDRVSGEMVGTAWEHDVQVRRLRALFEHRIDGDLVPYADAYIAEHPEAGYTPYVRLWRHLALGQVEPALVVLDSLGTAYSEKNWYTNDLTRRGQVNMEQFVYRGLIAEVAGDPAAAAQAFRQALEAIPDLPPHAGLLARVHLAWNLVSLGGFDEARREIRAALDVNPRVAEAVLVAAALEAADGEVTEARRLLDSLERMLERADSDFPALRDAASLREQLPAPGRI